MRWLPLSAAFGLAVIVSTSQCLAQATEKTVAVVKEADKAPDVLSEIHATDEKIVTAFNAGKAADVAACFLPEGEWIDEHGNVYQGRKNIEEVLTKYFEKYPGAEISLEIETDRIIGPLAIEEGVRTMTAGEDARAVIQYVAVLTKTESGWQLASVKDTSRELVPTAHAALQSLEWLVGEWVNEGSDATVHITYKWSDDRNYILADYLVQADGETVMKSNSRIGWDPLHGRIRSWLFDSDGGFGEGVWTELQDSWHIQSSAILPDGQTGSASITLIPQDDSRFTMKGTNRIIGGIQDDDFELRVVRKVSPANDQKPKEDAASPAK
ncbi:SgcJ/EcaC family oxidoreductase [Planctomicrobium sp. SH661]|uniref:SgcJ/EcaC family oxidoreductase n=1 Tax=Planctomicrobium sp. SH661 TaxID=3448124 RepID=UPI003F5BA64B